MSKGFSTHRGELSGKPLSRYSPLAKCQHRSGAPKPRWAARARLPHSASGTRCQQEILTVSPRFPPGLRSRTAARAPAAAGVWMCFGRSSTLLPTQDPQGSGTPHRGTSLLGAAGAESMSPSPSEPCRAALPGVHMQGRGMQTVPQPAMGKPGSSHREKTWSLGTASPPAPISHPLEMHCCFFLSPESVNLVRG